MLIITVRVIPNAKRQRVILDAAGSLKLYVVSQPEKGKANAEIITYFSKQLGLQKSSIEIVKGFADRKKTIVIHSDMDYMQLLQALGLPIQINIDT